MLPMLDLRLSLGTLFAADTGFLAAAGGNKLVLLKADFTPDENLVLADVTLADFDGYAAKTPTAGAQQVGTDPLTQEQIVTLAEPVGGWRWATTGLTNLPQTIFGFALLDTTSATLFAIQRLAEPLTLTAVGNQVNLGEASFRFVQQPVS
jgi:hypothetical protein